MSVRDDYEVRLESLDVTLFDAITSQSNADDKKSWLALQQAVRTANTNYSYLEIGSHLGGSMQSCLRDRYCDVIYSIDKRPEELPDDRGFTVHYPANSTNRMLQNLQTVAADQVGKVHTFDADARDVEPSLINRPPALCFIDGEHTKQAVLSDFEFCYRVCAENAVIYFHDDVVIHEAIEQILLSLRANGARFMTAKLGGSTFAIALRQSPALMDRHVLSLSTDGARFLRKMRIKKTVKRVTPRRLVPLARAVGALFSR